MSLNISDEVLHSIRMTEEELRQEVALYLFQIEKLTLGQASRLAECSQREFQNLLFSRHIPLHYGEDELKEDIQTLRDMNRG